METSNKPGESFNTPTIRDQERTVLSLNELITEIDRDTAVTFDSGAEKKCFPKKKAAAKPSATAAPSNSQSLRFRLVVLHELMVVSLCKIKTKKGFSVQVSVLPP